MRFYLQELCRREKQTDQTKKLNPVFGNFKQFIKNLRTKEILKPQKKFTRSPPLKIIFLNLKKPPYTLEPELFLSICLF